MAYPSSPVALPDPWAMQLDPNAVRGGMSIPLELKPGTAADPNIFQRLLTNVSTGVSQLPQTVQQNAQRLGQVAEANAAGISRTARYAPGGVVAGGQLAQGDIVGALGAAGLTAIAGKMLPAFAGMNPLARGVLQAATSLGAGAFGAQLGRGAQAGLGQLVGGAQAAVGDVTNTLAGAQRESGRAAGTGAEPGLGGISDPAMARQIEMLKQLGVNIPNQYLTQNYQIQQKYKNADVARQMQLNQQNAQLTGQLNQQIIAGQLAAGAQSQAGATTRDILTSNPYQASVLQTGGVRGI